MAIMHVHNVFPEDDTLHQNVKTVLTSVSHDPACQVHYLSFFFEFAFVPHYESKTKKLKALAKLDGPSFAAHCWHNKLLPVSPRYGQGDRAKAWYKQLLRHIKANDAAAFQDLIKRIHAERVFTYQEAAVIANIAALPPSAESAA